MYLYERFKNFPIQFYQDEYTGKVYYESGFTEGVANSLEDAFSEFSRDDFVRDLLYYYDDVIDVQFGSFQPSLTNKLRKGKQHLGTLNIKLDLQNQNTEQSVNFLSKNRNKIPAHLEYIKNLKKKEKFNKLKQKIKDTLKKVMKFNEMFDPIKSTTRLICTHCGTSIPMGTYFERYKGNDYHLECIWDKLVNKKEQNSYEEAEKFFFSLEKYIGNWPAYGFDIEEDYLSDLELVRHNNRFLKRNPEIKYLNNELNDLKEI